MAEYIEREAVLNSIEKLIKAITPLEESRDMFFHDSGANAVASCAMLKLKGIPAAEVAPVVHGRWIRRANEKKCSVCGFIYYSNNDEWSWCPNCGAHMKDGE